MRRVNLITLDLLRLMPSEYFRELYRRFHGHSKGWKPEYKSEFFKSGKFHELIKPF